MTRYIEREKFLKKCAEAWGYAGVTIKAIGGIVDECTAADVVPKAEVDALYAEKDRLNYILQCYALQYGTVVDKMKVFNEIRRECAVEIFAKIVEEIIAALDDNYDVLNEHLSLHPRMHEDHLTEIIYAKSNTLRGILDFIEELKQQYEEGE